MRTGASASLRKFSGLHRSADHLLLPILETYIMLANNGYRGNMSVKNILIVVLSSIFFFILFSGCLSNQGQGTGTINLTSTPPGAEVYVDNQYRGTTPGMIPGLPAGVHTVELRLQGYQTWSTGVTVSSGTYQFDAILTPVPRPSTNTSSEITPDVTLPASPAKVTVQASKDPMIIGDSMTFSGTCVGCPKVLLTLYGPGYYIHGVSLGEARPNSVGLWGYLWNPGTSILPGPYTLVVNDAWKTSSDGVAFSVVGGGDVTISASSYSAARGDMVQFSGRCTTGAQNVQLVLYGPDRFSSGVQMGILSVFADKTWNFKYTIDATMPTGIYTMYVYDVPKTTSGSTQFTIGYSSSS
jgi:hypothetical protein